MKAIIFLYLQQTLNYNKKYTICLSNETINRKLKIHFFKKVYKNFIEKMIKVY